MRRAPGNPQRKAQLAVAVLLHPVRVVGDNVITREWGDRAPDDIRREVHRLKGLAYLAQAIRGAEQDDEKLFGLVKRAETWIESAGDAEVVSAGPRHIGSFQALKREVLKELGIRGNWREMVDDYESHVKAGEFNVRHGIQVLWLEKHLRLDRIPWADCDLPAQARVGIGAYRFGIAAQDKFLLDDAFLALEKARATYAMLPEPGAQQRSETPDDVQRLAANAITYAKLAVVAFTAFFECFVNSLGEDYALRNKALLSTTDGDLLSKGTGQDGRYLSLPKKINAYLKLINPTAPPFQLDDRKQRQEPFRTYFEKVQDTRDSVMHHASGKAPIWHSPEEWKGLAETAAKQALLCAAALWGAAYPGRSGPRYLERFDFEVLSRQAQERVRAEREAG